MRRKTSITAAARRSMPMMCKLCRAPGRIVGDAPAVLRSCFVALDRSFSCISGWGKEVGLKLPDVFISCQGFRLRSGDARQPLLADVSSASDESV